MNPKSDHQMRVERFMILAGQSIAANPTLSSFEVRKFRADMILEEALEAIEGLGFDVEATNPDGELELVEAWKPDLIKIADGCADIRVVTTGTLSALGISDLALQEEVDTNNLLKFAPGAYQRSDGKWMKPPGHRPPDIEKVLLEQGWLKEGIE